MIRAVLDTNVVVSALISPFGNESYVLLEVQRGRIIPCFSNEILDEYKGVLVRPKFRFASSEVAQLVEMLRDKGLFIESVGRGAVSPDPKDEPFIDCAVTARANFLVTGNKRHFPPECCAPCRVVSAGELLDFLNTRQSP